MNILISAESSCCELFDSWKSVAPFLFIKISNCSKLNLISLFSLFKWRVCSLSLYLSLCLVSLSAWTFVCSLPLSDSECKPCPMKGQKENPVIVLIYNCHFFMLSFLFFFFFLKLLFWKAKPTPWIEITVKTDHFNDIFSIYL